MTQIMCKITIIILMYLESDIIRGGGDEDGDKERRRKGGLYCKSGLLQLKR